MTALAVVGATQMNQGLVPKSAASGGTSQSDPGAGGDANGQAPDIQFSRITTADKAGAAILTILVVVSLVGGGIWIIL